MKFSFQLSEKQTGIKAARIPLAPESRSPRRGQGEGDFLLKRLGMLVVILRDVKSPILFTVGVLRTKRHYFKPSSWIFYGYNPRNVIKNDAIQVVSSRSRIKLKLRQNGLRVSNFPKGPDFHIGNSPFHACSTIKWKNARRIWEVRSAIILLCSPGLTHKHCLTTFLLKFNGIPSGTKSVKMLSHMWQYHFICTCDIVFDMQFGNHFSCAYIRWCMTETVSGLSRKSSAIFGHFRTPSVINSLLSSSVRMRHSCCLASLPVPGVVWLDVIGRCLPVYPDRWGL